MNAADGTGQTNQSNNLASDRLPAWSPFLPMVSLSTPDLNFGDILVGDSDSLTVDLTNDGSDTLMVTDIALNPDGFSVSPTDAFNLAPGASATFTVTFAPTTMGSDTDTLTFSTNDPMNLMVAIPLSGRGADGVIAGAQATLKFDATRLSVGTPWVVGRAAGMTLQSRITEGKLQFVVYSTVRPTRGSRRAAGRRS